MDCPWRKPTMEGCERPLLFSSAVWTHLSVMPGWDVDGVSRRHITVRLRLKMLAACWDFHFSLWVSPVKFCSVFFSFTRAKIIIIKTINAWKVTDPMSPGLFSSKNLGSILFSIGCSAKYNRGDRVWPKLHIVTHFPKKHSTSTFYHCCHRARMITHHLQRGSLFFFSSSFLLIWFFLAQLVL